MAPPHTGRRPVGEAYTGSPRADGGDRRQVGSGGLWWWSHRWLEGGRRGCGGGIRKGQARAVIKDGHVVNRIHVEDIATAVMASIARPNPATVYNIADGHPAPPQDVIRFATDLLDLPHPPEVPTDDPSLSNMAKSFYSESKRVSNERARLELGWAPKHPDYQAGLRAILAKEN